MAKEMNDLEEFLFEKISNLNGKNKIDYSDKMAISHKMYSLIEKNLKEIDLANYVKILDNLYKKFNPNQ